MRRAWILGVSIMLIASAAQANRIFYLGVAQTQSPDRRLPKLKYPRDDIRQFEGTLRFVLGKTLVDSRQLSTPIAPLQLEEQLAEIRQILTQRDFGPHDLLVFHFSGHGDALHLHLDQGRVKRRTLRRMLAALPGRALMVLDACSDQPVGARNKGGRLDVAEISATETGKTTAEMDWLKSSLFTAAVLPAIRGAADFDGDGQVELGELVGYLKHFDMGAGGRVQATLGEASRTVIGQARPNVRWRFDEAGTLQLRRLSSNRQESLTKLRHTQRWAQPPGRYTAVLTTSRGRRFDGEIEIPARGRVDVRLDSDGTMRGKGVLRNVLRPAMTPSNAGFELRVAASYQRFVTDPVAVGGWGIGGDLRWWPNRFADWIDLSLNVSMAQSGALNHRELTVGGAAGWRFDLRPLAFDVGMVGFASVISQEGWPAAALALAPGGALRLGLLMPDVRWLPLSLGVDTGVRAFQGDGGQRMSAHVLATLGIWIL